MTHHVASTDFPIEQFAKDMADTINSTTTFEDKLNLTTMIMTSGNYEVLFTASCRHEDGSSMCEVECEINGVVYPTVADLEPKDNGNYYTIVFRDFITLSVDGTINAIMRYKSTENTKKSHLKYATVSVKNID